MRNSLNHLSNNIIGILEILLLIRIAFRVLQANPAAFVVEVVYRITDAFIVPVNYIFPNIPLGASIIDIVAISAMAFYAIVFVLAHKIINSLD